MSHRSPSVEAVMERHSCFIWRKHLTFSCCCCFFFFFFFFFFFDIFLSYVVCDSFIYEFDVRLCGISIALSDFIVTLCELAITFCAFINTLYGFVICLCWFCMSRTATVLFIAFCVFPKNPSVDISFPYVTMAGWCRIWREVMVTSCDNSLHYVSLSLLQVSFSLRYVSLSL